MFHIIENIKIKFFELNDDDIEIWTDYGRFSELDVHHQYAMVFRYVLYAFEICFIFFHD